jgi:hypothetical protein
MPRTLEMSKISVIFSEFHRSIMQFKDDHHLLIDMWDRHSFSEFVDFNFTVAEWEDFVAHCADEQIPWADWFRSWRIAQDPLDDEKVVE